MTDKTEKNLALAFAAESKASVRNEVFAKKAMNDMLADRETVYFVCQVCGYISEDEAPEKCPICGAVTGKFKPTP